MRKFFLYIIITNFISINAIATNIKIDHEINTSFQCKFEKIIIKNAEYNYKVFTSDDIDNENLDNFEIISKIPKDLSINGLSSFLSNSFTLFLAKKSGVTRLLLASSAIALAPFSQNSAKLRFSSGSGHAHPGQSKPLI